MERVTIREASHRLRLSRASIRECIRNGELKAYRENGPNDRPTWVVELPEEGWSSAATDHELNRTFSPWWWSNLERTGEIHYVEAINTSAYEEIVPKFLCGIDGANIWSAVNLVESQLCPDCLSQARERDLPHSSEPFQ
ncbi:MAG: helix-turn-helix domain-containing protein [Dehalococcoidia bacterium]